MGRLTLEERRRVFLTQQTVNRRMLAGPCAAAGVPSAPCRPRRRLRRLFETVMIVTLLVGGWFAYQTVTFHPPISIIEVLLPRL